MMTNLFSRSVPESVIIRGPIRSLSPSVARHFALDRWNSPAFIISGRTLGVKCKQSPLGNQQIRQAKTA
jgi:5-methylcytosine-specific restriction endonuclease McrA